MGPIICYFAVGRLDTGLKSFEGFEVPYKYGKCFNIFHPHVCVNNADPISFPLKGKRQYTAKVWQEYFKGRYRNIQDKITMTR